MPSSLKFLYKKGRPRVGKKKNKVYSLAKRKGNRHVDVKMLDNMFSPVYSVTKKDYGYSSVHDDAGATNTDLPDSGNLSSIQCIPGRQIYLEFNALPIWPMTIFPTGVTLSTYRRTWSFLELLYGAWYRNRSLVQQSNQVVDPSGFAFDTVNPGLNLPAPTQTFSSDQITSSTLTMDQFVENVLSNSAYNFKFQYMGGHQTHKFYNSTTLPVHGEIREFVPRQCMNFDVRRRLVGVSNQDCHCVPGMYQTLYADRIRLMNRETTAADAGGANYNLSSKGLYDEIDDRNFRYMSGMEETNFRWIVGPAQKFTIYPGETFTYKMVLPPFAGDSYHFVRNVNRKWIQLGGGSNGSFEVGNTPVFVPGFSKFVQIRMIGSRAYTLPRYADNDPTDPTYAQDSNNNAQADVGAPVPGFNNNRPILHSATHSVRVTHTVVEHHSMRTFPTYDGRIHIFTDKTANAENTADITRGDQMVYVDPVDNGQEGLPGDNGV